MPKWELPQVPRPKDRIGNGGDLDHVERARRWLMDTVGSLAFGRLRLTWRHSQDCPRLHSRTALCRCRPELWCNGGRVQVPDSVFGG